MSLRAISLLSRRTSPAIIPIAQTRSGNNKPKSLQKTKRTFKPNLTRVDWPVTLLGGPSTDPLAADVGSSSTLPKLRGVKMQMRRVRDVEKAGGIEGLLLSRRPKDLTPFGRTLRARVFDELHRIKDALDAAKLERSGALGVEDGSYAPAGPAVEGSIPTTDEGRLLEGR